MFIRVELCFELPFLKEELLQEWKNCTDNKEKERNIDKRTDLLATMLAMYPNCKTSEISKQLGISKGVIKIYARLFGIHKSKELLSEIHRQNGDHPKKGIHPNAKAVEKVARNGRVVATYRSTTEAARANGISSKVMYNSCKWEIHKYRDGYLYRYKKYKEL